MKAKIKETGEIIDVEHVYNPDDPSDYAFYTFDENGMCEYMSGRKCKHMNEFIEELNK